MNQTNEFPRSVIEKLGYYVYLFTDPTTNKVFYVGKGTGNRIFDHLNRAISSPLESDKLDKIRSIQSQGLQVKHSIIRHGLTEKEAFEVEAFEAEAFEVEVFITGVGDVDAVADGCRLCATNGAIAVPNANTINPAAPIHEFAEICPMAA